MLLKINVINLYSDIKAKVMDQLKFVFKDESEFDLTILDGILEELPDNINSDRETFANLTETYIKAAKSYKDSDLKRMVRGYLTLSRGFFTILS